MSKILINQYYNSVDRAIKYGKSKNETAIRNYFWHLLNEYAHDKNYEVIPEISCLGTHGNKVYPDGILKNLWGIDIGYWESKDEKDNIYDEIDVKIKKGYPLTNILFEDTNTAILFQRGQKVMEVPVRTPEKLDKILKEFVNYKNETIYKFEDAIEKFKKDIPNIIETLRNRIEEFGKTNTDYISARDTFFELCKSEINPDITLEDIREMMIQHLLTGDIFSKIFNDAKFHLHNTIASELEKLVDTLFSYAERRNLLGEIEHYYATINATAAGITDHHEKQKFLKVLYENFYKVYNPKAADRLGVVYTPNEIVRFMVDSTDFLLNKHFGKTLSDKNVEILDPATGTGTFITDIIENAIPKQYLVNKYQNEIHANEVAILPYYIASLNIEYTFKQKMGYYKEFENICFVDTLDNTGGLEFIGQQHKLFGITSENTERIKRQNQKKISVIIGNPPYNANQKNEKENNKNREYPEIDKRIKNTYINNSTAQKTKMYDMYSRFLRWASDRIDKNGIISFVSNSSFINSRTYDGFRKVVSEEFNEIYIIDLKGNARTSGERRRQEGGNIFSDLIRVGIAIYFLIKKEKENGFKIYYNSISDYAKSDEKKEYLKVNKIKDIEFIDISPDKKNNWINIADNDWDELIPIFDKNVKLGKNNEAIFKLYTLGTTSNRDDWVYDFSISNLKDKIDFFINTYNKDLFNSKSKKAINTSEIIKYTRDLKKRLVKGQELKVNDLEFRNCLYRVFSKSNIYFDSALNEMRYQTPLLFPNRDSENILIGVNVSNRPFNILASKYLVDLHFNGDCQCLPLYRYNSNGEKIENITDWGLQQFQIFYKTKRIKKEDIFHYVYAVLHNPEYRKKYELNLKREFPRIPFYDDFKNWCTWGKKLMDLHLNFETVEPYKLNVITSTKKSEHKKELKKLFEEEINEPEIMFKYQPKIKVILKADKEHGVIKIDELTSITGIPKETWEYKLGNRSAVEWILDQYKEKRPSDLTIAERFNSYRFTDYKDKVIDLIKRITTVSVETQKIISEMKNI